MCIVCYIIRKQIPGSLIISHYTYNMRHLEDAQPCEPRMMDNPSWVYHTCKICARHYLYLYSL